MKFLILFDWNVTPGHIENIIISVFFWLGREHTREKKFEADICCVEFLADRLVPFASPQTKIFRSYSGFRPFLESPFWPVTRKRLIFEIWSRFWAPISFQFLSDGPFTFFGGGGGEGGGFLITFPIFFWIWRGQKKYIWFEKPFGVMTILLLNGNRLNVS